MLSKNMRRCLSFVIALVMVFSLSPFHALGTETETHDHEIETQATAAPESTAASEPALETSEALVQIQVKIDDILTHYLGTTEMSAEDISAKAAAMAWETFQSARSAISELENSDEIQQLTETELQTLLDDNAVLCAFSDALEAKAAADNSVSLLTTVNVLDGQVSVTDTANSNTVSGGTVTITAKGSLFSKATNTVTITNETESTATLSFDYTASTYNSFTVAGASASASGTYSGLLDPGASVSVVIKSNSGFSNLTATLKLSNFSLTVAAEASNVTFNYDSTLGSVTAAGNAVANEDVVEGVTLADGIALVATAKSGTTFLGWIDAETHSVLSTSASFSLTPAADMTVKAVFVGSGSAPWFGVASATQTSESVGLLGMSRLYYYTVSTEYTHLFDDLNAAGETADASGVNKYIVLLNSGTLPAGDYTIPADVTLLIPFDAANTLYTTGAQSTDSFTQPKTPWRTLTLADDAKLIIDGAMSLSAKHRYTTANVRYGSSPTGHVSYVKMEGDSNITVNNGGALYVYGYITGSGSVTVNSGGTVYENFQIADFRGGTQSTGMQNGVFPLSQYYVQNIEVPMTLYSGAQEVAYTTVFMSSTKFPSGVAFIDDSGSMFNLTSGYVVKEYDGSTDRLIVDVHGDLTVSSVEIKVSTSSIDSKNYDLPINGNMTVNINSGTTTINQDLALLPGTVFTVASGATCKLGSGYNIYVYDADQWGTFCSSGNVKFAPLNYVPGRTYNRKEADLVDATILVNGTVDASAGYIYTTAGGANIRSDGTGVITLPNGDETVTYQLVQNTGYTEIPITPAKLKNQNADWVFTLTEKSSTSPNTYTYNAEEDKWKCGTSEASTHTEENIPAIAPTEEACGWTEGKRCCVCGEILEAPQELPPLVPGVIYGTSVLAGDSLDLYFYFDPRALGEGADLANYEIRVVRSKEGVAGETEEFNLGDLQSLSGYRVYAREDIAAKEMTDTVSVTVYHIDGTQISTTLTESIESYAIRALKHYSSDEELRTTLVDMLNYGAAAQAKWVYNSETLANAKLTAEQQGYATVTATATKDTNWTKGSDSYSLSATVTVESDLWFTFRFYPQTDATSDPLASVETATYTYQDHYGRIITGTAAVNVALDSATNAVSYYYVDVPGLAIADGRQIIKCTAGDSVEVDCSVQTYIWAMTDQVTDPTDPDLGVANALMKFIVSAHAYFHRDDS